MPGIRSRIAANTPGFVRKAVRMAEHYGRRQVEWLQVLREMRGASPADRATLYGSALLAPLTALPRLDGFAPPRLLRDAQLVAGGLQFRIRRGTDDIIHILAAREPQVCGAIDKLLREGDVFVDAGANIGFYSLIGSRKVGPAGRVYAVEMVPLTLAQLRDHLALNAAGNVTVIDRALADRDDQSMRVHIPPGKFGQASILDGDSTTAAGEVLTITLDRALAGSGPIRLIKMDLEGAEFMALSGATQVLGRTHAVIYESNSRDPRIAALLEGMGFAVQPIGGHDYLAIRREG